MNVGRICSRDLVVATKDETARTAAQRMRRKNVGTVVVVEGDDRPIGMVTNRDLTMKVVAIGKTPGNTPLRHIMTLGLDTVAESTPIADALRYLRTRNHRRLIVTNAEKAVVGLLSLDGILDSLSEEMDKVGELLAKRQPVRGPS